MARRRLSSPDQLFPVRVVSAAIDACSSSRLAVVLIAAAAAVLAWATFVESRYGTPAVRFGIYGTWWFSLLNLLLGLNVLFAALVRFPWKRHQTGFVITHAGILVLLAGCWLSRRDGIDAQLPLFEGGTGWRAFENSQHFELAVYPGSAADSGDSDEQPTSQAGRSGRSAAETIVIPFAAGPFNWSDYRRLSWLPWHLAQRDRGTVYDRDGLKLEVLDYYSDSERVPAPRVKLHVADRSSRSREAGPLAAGEGRSVTLSVQKARSPHGPDRPFGLGARKQLSRGERILFWMTGSRDETEAFRQSRPEGELGRQGQLVLYADRQTFRLQVQELGKGSQTPLGATGLAVELVQHDSKFLGVELRIHHQDDPPQRMLLLADYPEFNHQDYHNGVFGTYWVDATPQAAKPDGQEASAGRNEEALRAARRPRIDILAGADQKLYYRTWRSPQVGTIGVLPADGSEVVLEDFDQPTTVFVEAYIPHERPGTKLLPVPFDARKSTVMKERQARLRLTVDGTAEEFWLAGLAADPFDSPPPADGRKVVRGKRRRVAITMPRDQIDVGFQLYLHKFERKLDPGTSQASYYASLVDLVDRHDKTKRLEKNILITLNAPVNFSDPKTGRSYRLFQESFRGPWRPGDPLFDQLIGGNSTRSQLFLSWLTVNYDPGRGLKYAGCLMIVVGIGIMFYMRAYFFRKRGKG